MKKIMVAAAMTAMIVTMTACGGKSQASREQINNAHNEAREMLQQAHQVVNDTVR